MLLVDAVYINKSGGKVLLDYLVEELENSSLDIFYLFDIRIKDSYLTISEEKKAFVIPSMINRLRFYKNNRNRFQKILCFGNVPPPIKMINALVYTYFHNTLMLKYPKGYLLKYKLYVSLQNILLRLIRHNSNIWIVQSPNVAFELNKCLGIERKKITIIPFFKGKFLNGNFMRDSSFLYPSGGGNHKNHDRLLSAWDELSNEGYHPFLHLTISEEWADLSVKIQRMKKRGINIINHGIIPHNGLMKLYQQTKYLIFPSLTESFGLPLIEAAKSGCKIIAAELQYTHVVVRPSLTFDPYSIQSIKDTVLFSLKYSLPDSECLINDEIHNLIDELS